MDQLSEILINAHIQAKVFYSGNLCVLSEFDEPAGNRGHLHIFYEGELSLSERQLPAIKIKEPSLLYFPLGTQHRLLPDSNKGADLVCANIEYGAHTKHFVHPIISSLPTFIQIPIRENRDITQVAQMLLDEASKDNNGKQLMINKLCDIFILHVLRYVISSTDIQQGTLAALADKRLAKAVLAMHKEPAYSWQVESLAQTALMSRSAFALSFKECVGQSPLDYLTSWRIQLAQKALLSGDSVHTAANTVGYENGSALARVFKKKLGVSPISWLKTTIKAA